MNCSRCGSTNAPDARFCSRCGLALNTVCRTCGAALAPGARFCSSCGQPVAASAAAEDKHEPARAFRGPSLASERKTVTVLFADVVGSTALAENIDPEEWTGIMNGAFEVLTPAIQRYEGTIARLLGDALLVFFGAPVAHEDDPERAVLAALDLISATREYAAKLHETRGMEFAIRVGINTGPVVVGEVGSQIKHEYTAMGDAVNVAARLQAEARPMSILVAEPTHRAIAHAFDFADLGSLEMKGKSEPVRVFEVQGVRQQPRAARGLGGIRGPLVGRERELNTLSSLTDAACAGIGRVALLLGDPGLGKSRLVSEWRAAVDPGSATWAEGHCLSYTQSVPYFLLGDALRSLAGISATFGPAEARAALTALVERHASGGMSSADLVIYLSHLLSLPLDAHEQEQVAGLGPQELQARYLEAARELLTARTRTAPLVLVLDDVHWADASSAELFARLLPLASGLPLVICLVARPDTESHGWALIQAARDQFGHALAEIPLRPLADEEANQLLGALLDEPTFPDTLRRLILARADGNPFFVEEVIRMLIEDGTLVQRGDSWVLSEGARVDAVRVPGSLQALLLARIDRLPPGAKQALRVASVLGRQFPVELLDEVLAADRAAPVS